MNKEIPQGWELLHSEEEIDKAVAALIKELMQIPGIKDKGVILIQVLEGATVFAKAIEDYLDRNEIDVAIESVSASSYSEGPGKQGELVTSGLSNISKSGDAIRIIVDDMVDSGNTMKALVEKIKVIVKTAPVFSAVLLEKLATQFHTDFLGIKEATDKWIAGYGANGGAPEELGTDDGRNFPFIIARKTT